MIVALFAWAVSIACILPLTLWAIRNKRPALVAICVILAIQTHIRPMLFFLGLGQPFPGTHFAATEWMLIATACLTVAAWVVMTAASYLALSPASVVLGTMLPQAPEQARPDLVRLAALSCALLALAATGYFVIREGGIGQFVYAVKIEKSLAGSFVFREIGTLAIVLCLYGLCLHARSGSSGPEVIPRRYRVFFFGLILALFVSNYMWGDRYNIAVLVLAIGLTWHLHIRPLRTPEIVTWGLAILIVLQALKYLRLALFEQASGLDASANEDFWLSLSVSLHFTQFDAFMLALRDAGDLFAFRGGADFWNGLISWIPRTILPDRETFNIGPWFRRIYEPTRINGWPITVIGSWYVNFGALGLPLGAMISGVVAAAIDHAYRNGGAAWSAAMGPMIAFLMLDGGVNTGLPQRIVLLLIPLFLFALVLRLTAPRAHIRPELPDAARPAAQSPPPRPLARQR